MRTFIALAVLGSFVARAQAPGYLLNDLESAAGRDLPYFAVEARLRVAEVTRLSDVAVSRRFAEAAVRTGANPCGNACYYAMRTLAGLDINAAMEAAALASTEFAPAYRALAEQALYDDNPALFLRVLRHSQLQRGHFIVPEVYRATVGRSGAGMSTSLAN